MSENAIPPPPGSSFLADEALACLRWDLGLVPRRAREEARSFLRSRKVDGRKLVEFCLRGRAGDGSAALEEALRRLHTSLVLESVSRPPSRNKPSRLLRFTATLTGRLLVFLLTFGVLVFFLQVLEWRFESLNIYLIRDSVLTYVRTLLGP